MILLLYYAWRMSWSTMQLKMPLLKKEKGNEQKYMKEILFTWRK